MMSDINCGGCRVYANYGAMHERDTGEILSEHPDEDGFISIKWNEDDVAPWTSTTHIVDIHQYEGAATNGSSSIGIFYDMHD